MRKVVKGSALFIATSFMMMGCKTNRLDNRTDDGDLQRQEGALSQEAQLEGKIYRVSGKAYQEGEIATLGGQSVALTAFFDMGGEVQWPGKNFDKDGNQIAGGEVGTDLIDANGDLIFPQDLYDENGEQLFPDLEEKISPTTIFSGNPDAEDAAVLAGDSISVNTVCSAIGTEGAGTSMMAANSLSITAFKVSGAEEGGSEGVPSDMGLPGSGDMDGFPGGDGFEIPEFGKREGLSLAASYSEPLNVAVEGDGREVIKGIINEKVLKVDLSGLEDGQYMLVLCDGPCDISSNKLSDLARGGGSMGLILQPPKGLLGYVDGLAVEGGEMQDVKQAKVLFPRPDGLDFDSLMSGGNILRTGGGAKTAEEEEVANERVVAAYLDREDDLSQGEGGGRGDEGQSGDGRGDEGQDGDGRGDEGQDGDGRGDEGQDGDGRGDEGQDGDGRGDDTQFSEEDCDEISSPLVISVDLKPIQLSAPLSGVEFDIDADGRKEQISWVTSESQMLLTLDLNKNGQVDGGAELFGNSTLIENGKTASNGFSALAMYDSNNDQKIDHKDDVYSSLRLWSDKNLDGKSSADELLSLESQKVSMIRLDYQVINETDQYHNAILQTSTAIVDEKEVPIYDVWFRTLNVSLKSFASWLRD